MTRSLLDTIDEAVDVHAVFYSVVHCTVQCLQDFLHYKLHEVCTNHSIFILVISVIQIHVDSRSLYSINMLGYASWIVWGFTRFADLLLGHIYAIFNPLHIRMGKNISLYIFGSVTSFILQFKKQCQHFYRYFLHLHCL